MTTDAPAPDAVSLFDYVTTGRLRRVGVPLVVLLVLAVEPAVAQSVGTSFCQSDLASTIKNVFTLIQFGGPLIGGVVALGATVATPMVRRSDRKYELTTMRNQAIIWGVIVAPLGTVILRFLLNNVVVGGTSCGF
ncbi:hypothetical protein EFA46_012620 (plasmid) [Halarchaeum sp. CBA1220]|uniref:hypothetical protein n=1 Tax=Halarchaeum sp. CBA1220 TaxID=1853682 RepID=UPI000F3A82E6|nr:hypothetical protein [Halarchaeum sp. CBA1220]QLC35093.1 hypothetical protein EFA46_012620 [Halarchaeum sp. CBA1220]